MPVDVCRGDRDREPGCQRLLSSGQGVQVGDGCGRAHRERMASLGGGGERPVVRYRDGKGRAWQGDDDFDQVAGASGRRRRRSPRQQREDRDECERKRER